MILHDLRQTCDASPSQWEALNERNERVFIHFRFDTLTVHCPFDDDESQTWEDFLATQVLCLKHVTGNPYAGALETADMLRLTGCVI